MAGSKHAGVNPLHKGDHVYFRHRDGKMRCGEVHCSGRDGFVAKVDGEKHRVRHEHYVGHKSRAEIAAQVIEEGEDGTLAKVNGRTVFIHREQPKPMGKAMVLFLKAGPVGNKPGLILTGVTDKAGHQTKRWKLANGKHVSVGDYVDGGSDSSTGRVHAIHDDGYTVHHAHGETKVTGNDASTAQRFDATAHGKPSTMSDDEIRTLHKHLGDAHAPGSKSHAGMGPDDGEAVRKQAEDAIGPYTENLKKVAASLGGKVFIEDGHGATQFLHDHPGQSVIMVAALKHASDKGLKRATEKSEEINDETGKKEGWNNVVDLVRGSVVVPSLDDVPKALAAIRSSGLKVTRMKNRIEKDVGGYRDLLLNVQMENGHTCELQVHIAPMILAKEKFGGHDHYKVHRDATTRIKQADFSASDYDANIGASRVRSSVEMDKLYGHAWRNIRAEQKPAEERRITPVESNIKRNS
ncbi:hypothetical protein [Nevskia sp.]|uniref:hypothetical protein n=1 Tax=Nevskia sp. TaxID=1929292 RepID=UPI0025CD0C8D|nr:hypothetical protein [Nevskia sp.]